jgi:hypothetical protein
VAREFLQVIGGSSKSIRVFSKKAKYSIAMATEKPPNDPCFVIVINIQGKSVSGVSAWPTKANRTHPILRGKKAVEILLRHSVGFLDRVPAHVFFVAIRPSLSDGTILFGMRSSPTLTRLSLFSTIFVRH